MKVYEGSNIRNVAVIGHGHAGKTSLVSAMLYAGGASQRMGRVDDGTATSLGDAATARECYLKALEITPGHAWVAHALLPEAEKALADGAAKRK